MYLKGLGDLAVDPATMKIFSDELKVQVLKACPAAAQKLTEAQYISIINSFLSTADISKIKIGDIVTYICSTYSTGTATTAGSKHNKIILYGAGGLAVITAGYFIMKKHKKRR